MCEGKSSAASESSKNLTKTLIKIAIVREFGYSLQKGDRVTVTSRISSVFLD
jgi:hypothetical protein